LPFFPSDQNYLVSLERLFQLRLKRHQNREERRFFGCVGFEMDIQYRTVRTPTLKIAYKVNGPTDGMPVILLHGWPSDPHDYDDVKPALVEARCRVYMPWLRGFGPTRFLESATLRSGQQATLGVDLRDFLDALKIDRAIVCGYDWGGRAACTVAALWPERVHALISMTGYNLQDIPGSGRPASASYEHRLWYQWYFQTERGRAGLERNRNEICRLLWNLWSPNWSFDDATFEVSARSFENPDFVEVTIQSYRHRYGNAAGDPALEPIERILEEQLPIIEVRIIYLQREQSERLRAVESERSATVTIISGPQ
jgi:pimeloyl-ACP methyl ester carboxylesterase